MERLLAARPPGEPAASLRIRQPVPQRSGRSQPQAFLTGGFISTNVMKKSQRRSDSGASGRARLVGCPIWDARGPAAQLWGVGDRLQPGREQPAATDHRGHVQRRVRARGDICRSTPTCSTRRICRGTPKRAGVLDPTQAFNSPTRYSKGTLAEMNFRQGVVDIVVGRRPLTDL